MILLFVSMIAFAETPTFSGPLAKELYHAARRDVFASKPVTARIDCTWGMEAGDNRASCQVEGNKTLAAKLTPQASRKLIKHPAFQNFVMDGTCSRGDCGFPKPVEVRCSSGQCEILSEVPPERY